MSLKEAAGYGEEHARAYDQIYGSRFAPGAAVQALAAAAGSGSVLELGLGTGRLAIPLLGRVSNVLAGGAGIVGW